VSALCFNSDLVHIVAGTNDGNLYILHIGSSLTVKKEFKRISQSNIVNLIFYNDMSVVILDKKQKVSLLIHQPDKKKPYEFVHKQFMRGEPTDDLCNIKTFAIRAIEFESTDVKTEFGDMDYSYTMPRKTMPAGGYQNKKSLHEHISMNPAKDKNFKELFTGMGGPRNFTKKDQPAGGGPNGSPTKKGAYRTDVAVVVFLGGFKNWYLEKIDPDTDIRTNLTTCKRPFAGGQECSAHCAYEDSPNVEEKKLDRYIYITWGDTLEIFKVRLKEFSTIIPDRIGTFN
jgi:hypothetical protein